MRAFRSLQFRIVAAFLSGLMALVAALVFLMVQFSAVSSSMALITEGYLPLKEVVGRLDRDQQRVDRDVQRLINDEPRPGTGAASPAQIYGDALKDDLELGRIHARQAGSMASSPEEQAALKTIIVQLDRVEGRFQDYQEHTNDFVAAVEGGLAPEQDTVLEPLRADRARLGEEIDKLGRLVDGRIEFLTTAAEQARIQATAVAATSTALGLLFALGLLGAVLVALQPIRQLTEEVQRLAGGDYSRRARVRGSDEIALLAEEFNKMVAALQSRDQRLVERAEQLNRLSRYLGSVLDSLEDALLVVEDGAVTLTNPAAERWGANRGDPPPATVARFAEQTGRHEWRDERGRLHEIRSLPFGENGALIVATDVTEQTRAKEALARSERLALIGQMLAQITHEVRNPLNALSLNVELLSEELNGLDSKRETEAWEILELVGREIERLTAVTGHYLQLARRPPAQLAPTDLGRLLDEVHRLVHAELSAAGVRLSLDLQPVIRQMVDGNQVRQALLNVIRNAVEAGASRIDIGLHSTADQVVIQVSDDGPGMSEEEIDRALDPFFSTKASGTGLGLAITRQILDDHDGSVQVRSAKNGTGTTVELVLPNRPAPDSVSYLEAEPA